MSKPRQTFIDQNIIIPYVEETCLFDNKDIDALLKTRAFPNTAIVKPYDQKDKADLASETWVCFLHYPFSIGMTYPFPALVNQFFETTRICYSQVMPMVWRILFSLSQLNESKGTVFFSYIGFDSVASTAEEVKNPQRDLPLGIASALSICCILYMLVSSVIVGLVPYYAMDPNTSISSAFASHGIQWAAYIITIGAVTALCSTLMGSLLPQVSVGTLLAFTMVAISVLILRYVPPDEVPLPSSLQAAIDSVSLHYSKSTRTEETVVEVGKGQNDPSDDPLIAKLAAQVIFNEKKRRKIAGGSIVITCIGAFILTYSASNLGIYSYIRLTLCGIGGILLLFGLGVLSSIDQDETRHNFGHAGGFLCPFVPLLPILSILINTYLLLNLEADTWMRVSVWLLIGVFVYLIYGQNHSSLQHAVYVPASHVDEIYRSAESLPMEH